MANRGKGDAPGPSLDDDKPGGKLSRDLSIEREQPSLDRLPPLEVRKAWWGNDWEKKWREHRKR
jgi:hypothetical protein